MSVKRMVRIMGKSSCNQSYVSNELTHLVGRSQPTDEDCFLLLCKILQSGRLGTGQGNITKRPNQNLTSNNLLIPEMVCFCDIPLDSLSIHMNKYSRFGLAFTKTFMKTKGCNPVYYISTNSPCTDHRYQVGDSKRDVKWGGFFQMAFDEWIPTLPYVNGRIDVAQLSPIQNMNLWYVFGHVKFFDSTLPEDDPDNYYMEREWRIIGSMTFNLADVTRVIIPDSFVSRFLGKFSNFSEDRIHRVPVSNK